MKKICFILGLFSSCVIEEQESVGYYYIDNRSDDTLRMDFGGGNSGAGLHSDSVLPMQSTCFYTAREGTGGHVYPSNFFTAFYVWKISTQGDSLIYQGVRNNDWEIENYAKDRYNLYLHIQ